MKDEVLWINNVFATHTDAQFRAGGGGAADSYFMLKDNRDNSDDSRHIGAVPRRLLIGRAHHVLASAEILDHWMPRLRRLGAPLF